MSKEVSVDTEVDPSEDEIWVFCPECGSGTYHGVLAQSDYKEIIDTPQFEFRAWEEYQIVQCRGCRGVSFRKTHKDTESEQLNDRGNVVLKETEELFPKRLSGRKSISETYKLPRTVRNMYQETKNAISNDLDVLAGVGIRALVESVCKDVSAKGHNLAEKIDSLVDDGKMTEYGAEILHSLRIMGNQSAHEMQPHDEEKLETAFDVVEHLLNTVYIIPEKAESTDLPERSQST